MFCPILIWFDSPLQPCFNTSMPLFGPPNIDTLKTRRDVKGLLGALKYRSDPTVRRKAAQALAELMEGLPVETQEKIIPALLAALDEVDSSVFQAVVGALGAAGQPAILPLIGALRTSQERVREGAARALGRLGMGLNDPAYLRLAVDPLIGALRDGAFVVRRAAAWALGNIAPRLDAASRGLPVENLVLCLRDPVPEVRQFAAGALGKIGEGRAIRPLIAALEDDASTVRKTAAEALSVLGWHPTSPSEQILEWIALLHWERLFQMGEAAVPALLHAAKDQDRDVRAGAIRVLGKLGAPQGVETFLASLHDIDAEVRRAAAEALEQVSSPQAVEVLLQALRDRDREVRRRVIRALGRTKDARAVAPLLGILKSHEEDFVQIAMQALVEIGLNGVLAIIPALGDADSYVQERAASVLTKIGSAAVLPLIQALQMSAPPINEYAARILGDIGDTRAVYPLINALENPVLTGYAAQALGKLGDARAVPPLLDLLNAQSDAVRQAAALALGNIGDPQAVDALISLLKSNERDTRLKAANALLQMYRSNRLDILAKRKILAQQDRITEAHADHQSHVDNVRSSDCHRDEVYHLDTGIGLPFPTE